MECRQAQRLLSVVWPHFDRNYDGPHHAHGDRRQPEAIDNSQDAFSPDQEGRKVIPVFCLRLRRALWGSTEVLR
ncbi:hypothetical protein HNQ08_004449 [Deinococcus humi]|uniref:Uncharacterized protein n=1 Tax=Deinococcus humi TaxID=662880 RepID=A0A7W8K0F8_9DEIO|nr:hypothetical protein [Deinococcus humi]GGO36307.1 hypothetical protein GCM10008949_40020 [Deinococcus humi]